MRIALATLALSLAFPLLTLAAEAPTTHPTVPEKRTLRDCIQPAPKAPALADPDYILWCPCVIKVGDTYHLFASRWPYKYGMGGWTKYSEIVRAQSKDLLGPYKFQGVILQKRPDNWDNSRAHNVKVVKDGDKYLLFYINSANQTGYATADQISGPWTRLDHPVIKASNPAPLVRPDGSLYVFCRLKVGDTNRGIAFTAPTYEGPYTVLAHGENLLENNYELEDPTIWWANNQYNVLLNDWKGKATGTVKAGAQYFSKDGLHYTLMSPDPVFTKTVKFDDGSEATFARRERPFIFTDENGTALALFTTCLPKDGPARIIGQAVDHYVPSN